MRILLYSDMTRDRLGAVYQRAFEQLGHEVIAFDARQCATQLGPWLRNRYLHRLTVGSLALRALGASRWNESFLRAAEAARPDLVFILNGDLLMPATLGRLRQTVSRDTNLYEVRGHEPLRV